MSYILDALRRADAERERGVVPGLQSQQHTIVEEEDAPPPTRSRALVWAVGALSVALVGALAWNVLGGRTAPSRAVAEGAVPPASTDPAAATPSPVVSSLPNTPATIAPGTTAATETVPANTATTSTATTSAATVATGPAVSPTSPVVAATTPLRAEPSASLDEATQPRATTARTPRKHDEPRRIARATTTPSADPGAPTSAGTTTTAAVATAATPVAAATASNDTRIYQQSELPEDVRRELPKLAIGGSSYSGDAASRMLMINGQVFHEGDQLAPGLLLDRIKLKSAVLSYRGYRYEVTF